MDIWAGRLWGAVAVATGASTLLLAVSPARAVEPAKVKITGSSQGFTKRHKTVAIPSYMVTYITQQQATAVSSISSRTRLNTVLTGIDEAAMKRLANEAHADLVTQLTAAGVAVMPQAQAVALAQGMETLPGNRDGHAVGPGITIKKSVKKGWITHGADAAPALKSFHVTPDNVQMAAMMQLGSVGKIGKAAAAADAYAMIPQLTIDYIDMEAQASGFLPRAASTSGELSFSLRAGSGATIAGAREAGPGYGGVLRTDKDMTWPANFARIEEGAAGVRTGSMTTTTDAYYQTVQRARGDAVVADPMVWAGLVREAYKAQNALLVQAVVTGKP